MTDATMSDGGAGTAIFDINETALDLAPARRVIDELVAAQGGARAWFARLLQLSMTVAATGGYVDFSTLARHALIAVAETGSPGPVVDDAAWDRVAAAMGQLPAHPDVAPGLDRLREAGWQLVALTNSAPAAVEAQLERADLATRFDLILSVEAVRRYKPFPEPYRHACQVAGVPAGAAWMVACHDWDLAGARAAGLSTAFVSRPGQSWASTFPEPDLRVRGFTHLADQLIA